MRFTFMISMACILMISDAQGSIDHILEARLFGIEKDINSSPTVDSLVMRLVTKDMLEKSVYGESISFLIQDKYAFSFLPNIKLYQMRILVHPADSPYEGIFFNTLDSSLCIFDGGREDFLKVFRKNLPRIIDEGRVIELMALYFNTLSTKDPCYIINTFADYSGIWDSFLSNNISKIIMPDSLVRLDKDDVYKLDPATRITMTDYGYWLQLWTWNKETGDIDRWNIQVSGKNLVISERKTMFQNAGPSRLKIIGGRN